MTDQKKQTDIADELDALVFALSSLANFVRREGFARINPRSIVALNHDLSVSLNLLLGELPPILEVTDER